MSPVGTEILGQRHVRIIRPPSIIYTHSFLEYMHFVSKLKTQFIVKVYL